MKKIIYLDYDGTITNSKKQMINVYNKKYRHPHEQILDGEDVVTWDGGIDSKFVEPIFADSDFFDSNLEIFDGLEDALKMLKKRGYTIILYSKGSLLNISNKSLWLESSLKEYIDGWIFTGTNNLKMGKNQYDMSVNQEEGFSILIDDHIDNLLCGRDDEHYHNMPTYSICAKLSKRKDEEWNKDFTNESFTIYEWSDLSDIIDRIERFEELISQQYNQYNDKKNMSIPI
jgi:hypothetical protein